MCGLRLRDRGCGVDALSDEVPSLLLSLALMLNYEDLKIEEEYCSDLGFWDVGSRFKRERMTEQA